MAILGNTPKVTRNLIIVNILVFVMTLINGDLIWGKFALFYPSTPFFHFWQPVTYMFVHGGFWHIFFNMYSLWLFGGVVERVIGEKKFLLLYFICGLGAAGLHIFVQSLFGGSIIPCGGASGSVYGLMLAYAMLFPENKLTLLFPPVTLSAKWMVVIFAAIELVTGILSVNNIGDGVAHMAHLGGMLFALILILFWKKRHVLFDRDTL